MDKQQPMKSSDTRADDQATAATTAAERALAEAAERRALVQGDRTMPEVDGRGGLEPVRYGDWEVKGLASDF